MQFYGKMENLWKPFTYEIHMNMRQSEKKFHPLFFI